MKNLKKVMSVVACAAMVTSLTACSKPAKYTKVGFGMETTASAKEKDGVTYWQINTTTAAVALDKDGKIAYIDIDTAQHNTNDEAEVRTKEEKKEDYGMKDTSAKAGIGKEWYEQVAALEEYAIGKTPEEFAAIETEEKPGHPEAVKAGTDLAANCTIDIGAYKKAVAKAVANAVEVEAEKVGTGEVVSVNASKGEVNTTVATVALDGDGKIVWSYLDVAQTKDDTELRSKVEKKEDYNMKKASGIGKELYEQLAFFQEKLLGMDAAAVAGIELAGEGAHPTAPKADTDLATGCTINIGEYQEALAEAFANAK